MKDYYFILDVSRDATADEIRRAHRRQVLRFHPDRSREPDPKRFRDVQEAYEVLRDEERRRSYNHQLKAHESRFDSAPEPAHRGPLSLWEDFGTVLPDIEEILDHIRRDFFGPVRKVESLKDLNVEFILDPDEAASGIRVPLEVPIYRHCPFCGGRGDSFPFPCLHCDGKGWLWGKRTLTVNVPPGIRDGSVFQIPIQRLGIRHLHLNVCIRVGPD
jgi:DnaJ-class molecular chaperone